MIPRGVAALLAMLLGVSVAAHAMPARADVASGLQIKEVDHSDAPAVEVTIAVPEELGGEALSADAFTVTEDGGPPVAVSLGTAPGAEDDRPPPLRTVLAIDVSGSMRAGDAIARARQAAIQFVELVPSSSEVGVVAFGDEAEVALRPTTDRRQIRAAIAAVDVDDPEAVTALYGGLVQAAGLLRSDDRRQSVVVLSDGRNTVRQGPTLAEARTAAEARSADVWAVELTTPDTDADALTALAGGAENVVTVEDASELEAAYAEVATALSRQYVLRWESQAQGDTRVGISVTSGGRSFSLQERIDLHGRQRDQSAAGAPAPTADLRPYAIAPSAMATPVALGLGIVAVVAAVVVLALAVLLPQRRSPRVRLLQEQRAIAGGRPQLSSIAEWTTDFADRRVREGSLGRALDQSLESAGLDLRPGELVVITGSVMMVFYAVGAVAAGPLLGVLLALIVPVGVRLVLGVRRDRRQHAFADQLTEVLQVMTGSLRAGYGLLQGVDAVARDADEPAATEFRRIIVEHRLGRDLNEAMGNCATRMNNEDFRWVVQAIGIHRDVGGDLARVLDNIVSTVRDRADVQRDVRTLSAEGRTSARVLTALPFLVLVVLQVANPSYVGELTTRPLGLVLLAGAALQMLVGTLIIQRIAKIRY